MADGNPLLTGEAVLILCDTEILELIDLGMITPAVRESVGRAEGKMSYGPSSYGYDVRLGNEFLIYRDSTEPLDPLRVTPDDYHRFKGDEVHIEPGGFLLGVTMETIRMPPNVTAQLCDKSSLARAGVSVQNTIMEAGWFGEITLEIHNQLRRPVILRAGQGIGQLIFFRGAQCATTYDKRGGKYLGQKGVQTPLA